MRRPNDVCGVACEPGPRTPPRACARRIDLGSPSTPLLPSPSSHLHDSIPISDTWKRVIACAGSDDGRLAGEGRCSCRGAACPAGASHPPGPPAPARPIAKFNAKVMRARVRLRAAMQERPAAGEPSVPHGRPRNTPLRDFPQSTRPTGSLD
ncbi:uncharacterized protein LOC114364329 [Ostrinia furnacalis]|uniref:uncharacterized protein LOC114364329 n=1 Tax=Ostrinia furnacalis TaxID=93504 RepID=UPI00103DD9BA|nr:uncharacterized protein LOC114364329 [Ostrinia furnacalis]